MDKYKNIPEALKARNQWVCYELVYDNEKGKSSKIPKNPHNGYNAKSNDSATWSDFETAIKAASFYGFSGIGFVLGGGIFGIDLDNAIDENGNLTKEAADIVSVMDSYTEISPSGSSAALRKEKSTCLRNYLKAKDRFPKVHKQKW